MPIDLEGEIAKAIAEGGINDDLSDREWPQLHEVRKAQYRRLAGTVLARLESLGLVVVRKDDVEELAHEAESLSWLAEAERNYDIKPLAAVCERISAMISASNP